MAATGPVDCEPLTPLAPDQAPEALQAVAWLDDQVKVEAPPRVSELGLASIITVGGGALTVTMTDCIAEPPAPVQVRTYSVVFDSEPVDHVPLVATAPLQPSDARQFCAFWVVQVRVALPPAPRVVGDAVRLTLVAAEVTTTRLDWLACPPEPVQVSVKVVSEESGPVAKVPAVG